MKRHWVRLQLRFEALKDVKLEMTIVSGGLKWQYIAIIATFSSILYVAFLTVSLLQITGEFVNATVLICD